MTLSRGLSQSVSDGAIDFFLATHILRGSGPIGGYYQYLPVFYNGAKPGSALSMALTAVALAAYANAFRYPDLLTKAERYFGSALGLVNKALSSREDAAKASTIISIMLLSTFAAVTCKNQESMQECRAHLSGMMAIIKLLERRQSLGADYSCFHIYFQR